MSDPADPFALFSAWYTRAAAKEINDPNGMALATVSAAGLPDLRMVLLKGFDSQGFVFYTNVESAKGEALAAHPTAALLFHWKSLRRQIRIQGGVEPVRGEEADAYFATRPREAQIGAWASRQSRPMEGRFELEREVARFALKFGVGAVPRPPFWSGYRVVPQRFEFWTDKPFRLHERLIFIKDGTAWRQAHLFP
jgi:pyridoxamine 5'-phosphate oxidase